jgi:hypothetical protein
MQGSRSSDYSIIDRIFCLLCAYIRYSMFYFLYLDVYFIFVDFTVAHRDRKYYYVMVIESIQFVCTGNSEISRDLCNANTTGLFMKDYSSTLALSWTDNIPWDSPISNSISLRFIYTLELMAFIHKYFNQSDWLLYFSVRGGYSGRNVTFPHYVQQSSQYVQ